MSVEWQTDQTLLWVSDCVQTLKYVNCKKTDCVGEREAEQKEEDKDAKRERKKRPKLGRETDRQFAAV